MAQSDLKILWCIVTNSELVDLSVVDLHFVCGNSAFGQCVGQRCDVIMKHFSNEKFVFHEHL